MSTGAEDDNTNISGKLEIENLQDDKRMKWIFRYKILKQTCIILVWISIGLFVEIVGPTLPDLADRLGVNYEEISRALIGKSVGLFVGSLVGGFLHEIFHRHTDLILAISVMIAAVGVGLVPVAQNIGQLGLFLAFTGFSEGMINTGGNTLTLKLWGDKAAAPMQAIHFGFAAGAMIAPQIARPFLIDRPSSEETNTTTVLPVTTASTSDTVTAGSLLQYPYAIVAIVTAVVAILLLLFYILPVPTGFQQVQVERVNLRSLLSPASCGAGSGNRYVIVLLILTALYFSQATGGERLMGRFLATFAVESKDVRFQRSEATSVVTIFWACHLFGRFSGVFLARLLPISVIITIDLAATVVVATVMAIFAHTSQTALAVLAGFAGLVVSVQFPSGFSWANLHLNINSMASMVFLLGAAIGGLIYQYVPGSLLQAYGPRSIMFIMLFYSLLISVFFTLMALTVRFKSHSTVSSYSDLDGVKSSDQDSSKEQYEVKQRS